ncbi:hypothetical protein F4679DRAFT_583910 [Xylaria curta]|nr:hypothetical protein F4679DRAFT_583910 [Xylaria curta]
MDDHATTRRIERIIRDAELLVQSRSEELSRLQAQYNEEITQLLCAIDGIEKEKDALNREEQAAEQELTTRRDQHQSQIKELQAKFDSDCREVAARRQYNAKTVNELSKKRDTWHDQNQTPPLRKRTVLMEGPCTPSKRHKRLGDDMPQIPDSLQLGHVYDIRWEETGEYYPGIVLPLGSFETIGIDGSIDDVLRGVPGPECYRYEGDHIIGWRRGYEDGGLLANQREYPILFLDENEFSVPPPGDRFLLPSGGVYDWVSEDHIQDLSLETEHDLRNSGKAGLIIRFRERIAAMRQTPLQHRTSHVQSERSYTAQSSASQLVFGTGNDTYHQHPGDGSNDNRSRSPAQPSLSRGSTPPQITHSGFADSQVSSIQTTTLTPSADSFEAAQSEGTRQSSITTQSDAAHELSEHQNEREKPYRCEVPTCPSSFASETGLKRHKKSQHSGAVYVCPIRPCTNKIGTWRRADSFRNHLKYVHSITVPQHKITEIYPECRVQIISAT